MYAHQVIEDLLELKRARYSRNLTRTGRKLVDAFLDHSIAILPEVPKFHLGKFSEITQPFKWNPGQQVFTEDIEFIRLPYKICWFDYIHDIASATVDPDRPVVVRKRGILAKELAENVIEVWVYNHAPHTPPKWMFNVVGHVFSLGKPLPETTIWKTLTNWGYWKPAPDFIPPKNANHFPLPLLGPPYLDPQRLIELSIDDSGDLATLECALKLLNCKNIVPETVPPSINLNKKRKKNHKTPLFSYHILKLRLLKRQEHSTTNHPNEFGNTRLHLCRGHFKRYTTENPLFGKYIGLWWWQPHVRGDLKKGIVEKDYELTT